jgi:hypothetical protein
MIRIAITAAAFEAINTTLPFDIEQDANDQNRQRIERRLPLWLGAL